jgi:hypothetical protein
MLYFFLGDDIPFCRVYTQNEVRVKRRDDHEDFIGIKS